MIPLASRLARSPMLGAVTAVIMHLWARGQTVAGDHPWGTLREGPPGLGLFELKPASLAERRFSLPTPLPNLVSVAGYDPALGNGGPRFEWTFNADATQLVLEREESTQTAWPMVRLETAERSQQFPDGRIVFSALDAKVTGTHAKLESHPGNHRIGFWTNPSDVISWEYQPTRWGVYQLELTYSAAGPAGTVIEVALNDDRHGLTLQPTQSWYRYRTVPMGRVVLTKTDPLTIRVSCAKMAGGAVMNLKALLLRPAPESAVVAEMPLGYLSLHASNAVTHSVTMRYEPQTNKNCLGYWVNPADTASWSFRPPQAGEYDIEVWQGCGKGHGGSDVAVHIAGQRFPFVVEDTGHFQNFVPRRIGRITLPAGTPQLLAIKPEKKKGGAVMDIREIRLIRSSAPAATPK